MILPAPVEAVLCDADGNLFPSEEPAFDASAEVTNAFLASLGVDMLSVPLPTGDSTGRSRPPARPGR